MSGAARIHMQHFQVGRLAAPAAVMLTQLQALGAQAALPVPATLFKNPALLIRALDALHRTASFPAAASLATRLNRMDQDWLDSLIRRTALHLALQDVAPNHAFLLRHWYVSRRLSLTAAALAGLSGYADVESAACCGLLLRAGMLALEQQQSASYAVLTAGTWQQGAQLAAERELFQLDHVEAGVRIAQSWQLDQFSVDAVRYQGQTLEQVLDAAPLIKICWYANALTDNATPTVLRASHDLLNIATDEVQALLASVQQELDAECAALGLPDMRATGNAELTQEEQQKLHQLRQEISTDNMLAQHTAGRSSDAPLNLQLARVLQDAGIDPVFIVLGSGPNKTLEVRASHRVQPDPAGLRFACAAGRNALSTLVLKGEAGVLTSDTPNLTVIDRQLLTLLGGQTVLCEPLGDGNHFSVLLLGLSAGSVASYLAQHTLRRFIGQTLLTAPDAGAVESASTLLLQQRVREAVHEANNPLSIIKNYLYILGMKQGEGQMAEEIQLIRTEIDRVAGILSQLREPKATSVPRKMSLNKIVTSMHRLFASSFHAEGKRITVDLQLATDDPQVFASENALKQILTNLVKNSAEAIVGEGTITLATQRRIYMHDRFYAQISIRDDGPGIAQDLMTRLFKPGTSTKGVAHAGSGLDIVRRLVEEMGGQIGCRSDSKGTAMDILLPLSE